MKNVERRNTKLVRLDTVLNVWFHLPLFSSSDLTFTCEGTFETVRDHPSVSKSPKNKCIKRKKDEKGDLTIQLCNSLTHF